MTKPSDPSITRIGSGRRLRIEARLMILLALAIIVLGGLYVLFWGAPNASRQVMDSSDHDPIAAMSSPSKTK